jgi:hypothetical protein
MAKVSRPIIYTVVSAVIGYTAFTLTQPAPPKKAPKKTTTTAATQKVEDNGILPEDLKAHFKPYVLQHPRDVFLAGVVSTQKLPDAKSGRLPNGANWVLTGIASIDNVKRALLENSATQDSVFLKVGDKWNNLRVLSVGDISVHFVDATGRQTALGFPEPTDSPTPSPNQPNPLAAPASNGAGPDGQPTQFAVGRQGGVNGT